MESSKGGPLSFAQRPSRSTLPAEKLLEADSSEQPTLEELVTLLSAEEVTA